MKSFVQQKRIATMGKELQRTTIGMKAMLGRPFRLRAIMLLTLSGWVVTLPNRAASQTPAVGTSSKVVSEARSSSSSRSLATIPFELFFNEIYVRVRVNNSEPLWFVVDSGAGGWIVDRAHATQLGLHLEQDTAQGTGAGSGTYDVSYVKDVTFSLSDFNIPVPLIGVIDLSAHKSQIGREIQGLVGFDFFEKFIVEIDYESKVIRLFDPKAYRYLGSGENIPIIVDQDARVPYFTAEITVPGAAPHSRKLLIDTGSNDALDDSFVAQSIGPMIETVGGVGLGKEFKFDVGKVSRLKLGEISFEDINAGAGGVALVGGEILRRFTVIFDFAHSRMILEPNRHLKDAFLFDASGVTLQLVPESGNFSVHSVMQGSPASEAGLREGDLIQSIDGLPSEHYTLPQVGSIFRRVGAEHHLTVRRGNQLLELDIKLRKLL
ncbi:MAG: aspartyl protease family protein [Terriglobales bacterium]